MGVEINYVNFTFLYRHYVSKAKTEVRKIFVTTLIYDSPVSMSTQHNINNIWRDL